MRFDELGPYSITRVRGLAHQFPPTARNGTVVRSARLPAAPGDPFPSLVGMQTALTADRPLVLLWRERPDYGHFIALFIRRRAGKGGNVQRVLELYDPVGIEADADVWEHYLDDPLGLNSDEGGQRGLRPLLQHFDREGVELSYNGPKSGPQPRLSQSCGLHCLLRLAFTQLTPSEFARLAK